MAGDSNVGSPDWWLSRLIRRLGDRQPRYKRLNRYAIGDHPLPDGDARYVRALEDLQKKSRTNYVGLILKAVTQRMRLKEFKFRGVVDPEAGAFWKANAMEMQAGISISDAAKFGDAYAMVAPPEDDGIPVITIEDPRNCIVERNPVRPTRSLAGLKFYPDDMVGRIVACLYIEATKDAPAWAYIFHGPKANEEIDYARLAERILDHGYAAAGFELIEDFEIPFMPLIYGQWQPESGLAECEDGILDVQDRINHTMLARLIITRSQAYRQRLLTGVTLPKTGPKAGKAPYDPGADALWIAESKDTKVYDLEQADITQLLEALRDDIGDLAALSQTPVSYLTNKLVNISGDTLRISQHSHVAKVRRRMDAMGWFFEAIIKTCFRYLEDDRANEPDAEVHWADPEVRTAAEMADLVSKFTDGGVPIELVMERVGFTADEIKRALVIVEQRQQEEHERALAVQTAKAPNPTPGE
jgi:hypothetical protein